MSTWCIYMSGSTRVHKHLCRPCMPEYSSESWTLCLYVCICICEACKRYLSMELSVMKIIGVDFIAVWIFCSFNDVFISSYTFKIFWKLIGLLSNYHNSFVAAGTYHPAMVYHLIFQASSEWNASGHLGSLCLSCFDSSIKGISCDTSWIGSNFNESGPSNSLYFSVIYSHSWGMFEHVYLLSSFFKPTDFCRQFMLFFLSLLSGCDSLVSQLLSSGGTFGSSCFNAFIEMFFLFFCGFTYPTLYSFAWLQMILSLILRQLFMKSIITLCFFRNGVPNKAS